MALKAFKTQKELHHCLTTIKVLTLKKVLRQFFMTFKFVNAEKELHRFLTTLKVFNTEKGQRHCLKVFMPGSITFL